MYSAQTISVGLSARLILYSVIWLAVALISYGWAVYAHDKLAAAFLIIGYSQYILLQIMHESIHQVFPRKTWLSPLMGALHNFPLGVGRGYAQVHFKHHQYFGDAKLDPDYMTYSAYPKTWIHLSFILLGHLSGVTTVVQLLSWQNKENKKNSYRFDWIGVVAFQGLLFGAAILSGHWWIYFTHWLTPLVTIVKALGYLRIVAEHSGPDGEVVLRSFRGSKFICSVLGPFGFQHHGEHHIQAAQNYLVLRLKAENNEISENVIIVQGSHFNFWYRVLKSIPLR